MNALHTGRIPDLWTSPPSKDHVAPTELRILVFCGLLLQTWRSYGPPEAP